MRLWLRYVGYWRKAGRWPSYLQRLFMQGDPTGEVSAYAEQVIEEMRRQGMWD